MKSVSRQNMNKKMNEFLLITHRGRIGNNDLWVLELCINSTLEWVLLRRYQNFRCYTEPLEPILMQPLTQNEDE